MQHTLRYPAQLCFRVFVILELRHDINPPACLTASPRNASSAVQGKSAAQMRIPKTKAVCEGTVAGTLKFSTPSSQRLTQKPRKESTDDSHRQSLMSIPHSRATCVAVHIIQRPRVKTPYQRRGLRPPYTTAHSKTLNAHDLSLRPMTPRGIFKGIRRIWRGSCTRC